MTERVEVRPHPGPQEAVLATFADIAIYGGQAGGGKTWALLAEPIRHIGNKDFGAVIFRRTSPQITSEGGLWDESLKLYPQMAGKPSHTLDWTFPSGARIGFRHLQYENDKLAWQGAQVPLLCCEVGTKVRMADGEAKAIESLVVGDAVQTLNGNRFVTAVGEPKLRECVVCTTDSGTQVHSTDHKLLTQGGWVSYEDALARRAIGIVCEFRQPHDTGRSIARHSSRRFALWTGGKPRCQQRCRGRFSSRPRRISGLRRLQRGRRSSLATSACTGPVILDTGCESFACDTTAPSPQPSAPRSPKRRGQTQVLAERVSWRDRVLCGVANARLVKESGDCLGGCSACSHLCDECVHQTEGSDRSFALRLSGVVRQTRTDSLSDGPGTTQKRTRRKRQYAHPYTGQERTAAVETELTSVVLSPCGMRKVVDITVEGECHYITENGLSNKNCFDELTHFSEGQFFYMMSRNRSTCGVRPYVRATTNPVSEDDPIGGWVHRLISWWINPETGYAIPERSGVVRWFIRYQGQIVWGGSKAELHARFGSGKDIRPKSLTFIHASLDDNPTLTKNDPDYRANLLALPLVEQMRLLGGNWKVKLQSGLFFKPSMIEIVDVVPPLVIECRGWDLAATHGAGDSTAGVKVGEGHNGSFYITDLVAGQWETGERDRRIVQTAQMDGQECHQRFPQDPAAAGKSQKHYFARVFAGLNWSAETVSGKKTTRASGLASQVNCGNVKMLRGDWNRRLLDRMDMFPTDGVPDDEIDGAADGFNYCANTPVYDYSSEPDYATV